MRTFKCFFSVFTTSVLLLGSAHRGTTDGPPLVGTDVAARATTISTGNCNQATTTPAGLCQAAPACNGGAGPNPDDIRATIVLCEYNGTLTVTGTGTGFRFGTPYVSLIYKNGNTATCSRFPPGVDATVENATNPLSGVDNDFASMHLGFWIVKSDGSALLRTVKQATVLGLQNYGSVSVREMQPPNTSCYMPDRDPAPQLNALRACGSLTIEGPCGPDPCDALPELCDICRHNPDLCD
jgi:hypothetical protein